MQAKERTIFLDAIEIDDLDQRFAFINVACGSDESLRLSVLQLLKAHEHSNNAIDLGPFRNTFVAKSARNEATMIDLDEFTSVEGVLLCDGYRIAEKIGEGGFGIVYAAQQNKPVRRHVALKTIKSGMGTKDVLARFETERQALAMMDHPGIAKIFDAGVSKDGRPYFVMELVRGIPLTEFCDNANLCIRQRLELFESVCAAVHHAHQKGIIHRDLKPSNLLTTLYDNKPVVKVIDFGIAKAMGQPLTDKTVYTRFMSMMGTPLYMSPEQAEMNSLSIDTRSDIYALGVLLYELLTGTTPIEKARLDLVGLHELRKIILEEEPPRPSQRLTALAKQTCASSQPSGLDPVRSASSIRGDLDSIVLKAIDKDRKRRYETAEAFANDIRRFLNSKPIIARPPTKLYRVVKFARRNRVTVFTSALIAFTIIETISLLWIQQSQQNKLQREKDAAVYLSQQAEQQAITAQKQAEQISTRFIETYRLLQNAQHHLMNNEWFAANENCSKAIQLNDKYYLPWLARSQIHVQLNLWDNAAYDLGQAIQFGEPTSFPNFNGAGALLALQQNSETTNRFFEHQFNRLNSQIGIIDWVTVRNCLFTSTDSNPETWGTIADQLACSITNNFDAENDHEHGHELDTASTSMPFSLTPCDSPRLNHLWLDCAENNVRIATLSTASKSYLTGLAYLKSKNPDRAIEYLSRAASDPTWKASGLVHAPLAIASFHRSEFGEARTHLKSSEQFLMRQLTIRQSPSSSKIDELLWFEPIEALLTHRQASQLLFSENADLANQLERLYQCAKKRLTDSP